jgi:hypothetical protein
VDARLGFEWTGLENLHVMSSELVKFLLVNTSHESISGLGTKAALLEAQPSDLQKIARTSEKASVAASNKADKLKRTCNTLVKRIAKLE